VTSATKLGSRLRRRYAVRMASAQFLAAVDVIVVLVPLHGKVVPSVAPLLTEPNALIVTVLALAGAAIVAIVGALNLRSSLSWFLEPREPSIHEKAAAMKMEVRQSALLLAIWGATGAAMMACNVSIGFGGAALIGVSSMFGATISVFAARLWSQRTLRPLISIANTTPSNDDGSVLRERLLAVWVLCGVLPIAGIVGMTVIRSQGWIIERSAAIEIPITVLAIAALSGGLRAVLVLARSIADPVRDVVHAMADVQQGNIDVAVDVYERSELGLLQTGFNDMVSGLQERRRLRDLFTRHVGKDVVHRAVDEQSSLGEVRDVAVLFIDLAGSTQLAASRSPREVASILNDFFRIVVATVNQYSGLVNKFQGDAALVIFENSDGKTGAEEAMAAARLLRIELRQRPRIDFGIGLSAGPSYAGNIGSEYRYEYTVIGDAVNEAARLADLAKSCPQRTLCSDAAYCQASSGEKTNWKRYGVFTLRGRWAPTVVMVPHL
jgi:adenylate cyclase